MRFDLIQIAGIIAAFLSVILGLFFIHTRKKFSINNAILASLLIIYAIIIISSLVLTSGINRKLFLIAHICNQTAFLIGPLIYFYIKSQVNPDFSINNKILVHTAPYLIATIYLIIKFFVFPIPITCRFNHIIIGSLAFLQTLTYLHLSLQELKKNGIIKRPDIKSLNNNKLSWLAHLVCGCFFLWLLKLLFFVVWDVSAYYSGCNEVINLYFLVSFLLFIAFLYFILLKPQLFQNNRKYKYSILTDWEKNEYKMKLVSLMEKDKLYLNSLLSLGELAKKLFISEKYVSQIINESFNKSFYEFINWYRIIDCKNYLANPKHSQKTILSIAYDVGFNSKSTFNASFIKFVGVTPKEYRKKFQVKEIQEVTLEF